MIGVLPRHGRNTAVTLLVALVAATLLFTDALSSVLAINLTPSLPRGLYRVTRLEVRPGALVTFCVPSDLVERHGLAKWIAPGRCPGGRAPLCKRIVVVGPGKARCGRVVWPVAAGEIFVRGASASSQDSCVFGPVPTTWLRGGVAPLLTL